MKPESQSHEPSLCAAPWPEHVVASECWHELPAEPESQTHEPSVCAAPWPEHSTLQSSVEKPVAHSHEPSVRAAPWPEQVVAFEYWHELPAEPAGHAVSQLPVE